MTLTSCNIYQNTATVSARFVKLPGHFFHRPAGRPFSDISLSVLACAVGKCCTCLLNRCLLSIAPLEDLSLTLPGRLLRAQGVSRAHLLNRRLLSIAPLDACSGN